MDIRPIIAVTMGDPAGIGPETALKALARPGIFEACVPVLVGDGAVLRDALRFCPELRLREVRTPREAPGEAGTADYIDLGLMREGDWQYGAVSAACGEAAFQAILRAIGLASQGAVQAVVTAPLNKEALHLSGRRFAGHTEIFAHFTNTGSYAMLLSTSRLRVIHATTHLALREACALIRERPERVLETIRLAAEAMRLLGVACPRIGVAGLNPHCGEGGLFGDEETVSIRPAVERARAEGLDVAGPVPPDTVFVKGMGGVYDIVVAMYHDQGHIPVKMSGFSAEADGTLRAVAGVDATIGLPFIRTSADHGTAFDIAGTGRADGGSMADAIRMAVQMARVKAGTR